MSREMEDHSKSSLKRKNSRENSQICIFTGAWIRGTSISVSSFDSGVIEDVRWMVDNGDLDPFGHRPEEETTSEEQDLPPAISLLKTGMPAARRKDEPVTSQGH